MRLRLNYAVAIEKVIGSASVGLVPTIRGFKTEAGSQFQIRLHLKGILNVASRFYGSPVQFGGSRNFGERGNRALQKGRQTRKRRLPKLVLSEIVVCLNLLEPCP